MVNSQFANAFTDRLDIPRISKRKTTDANVDASLGRAVAQSRKPIGVLLGLADFKHVLNVSHGIRMEHNL